MRYKKRPCFRLGWHKVLYYCQEYNHLYIEDIFGTSCKIYNWLNIFCKYFMNGSINLDRESIVSCHMRHSWFESRHGRLNWSNSFRVGRDMRIHQRGNLFSSWFVYNWDHYLRVDIQADRQGIWQLCMICN